MEETKKGLFRNNDGSWSLKKILGAISALSFIGICWMKVFSAEEIDTILSILDKLGIFSGSLLGLKLISGGVSMIANKTGKTE